VAVGGGGALWLAVWPGNGLDCSEGCFRGRGSSGSLLSKDIILDDFRGSGAGFGAGLAGAGVAWTVGGSTLTSTWGCGAGGNIRCAASIGDGPCGLDEGGWSATCRTSELWEREGVGPCAGIGLLSTIAASCKGTRACGG